MLPGWGTLPERLYLTDLSLWFWEEYGAPDFYPLYGWRWTTAIALGARERRGFSLQAGVFKSGPD